MLPRCSEIREYQYETAGCPEWLRVPLRSGYPIQEARIIM